MPTVVLVGRPNVGKSTLFNKLTKSRDALVADIPGLTRDRRYGHVEHENWTGLLVDTGGLFGEEELATAMGAQVDTALDEADLALFVTDARAGLMPDDEDILARLRRRSLPVLLVVNKIDGVNESLVVAEFAGLGIAATVYVAAAHARGMGHLCEAVAVELAAQAAQAEPVSGLEADQGADQLSEEAHGVKVALVGRPNVGKSTLTNRLLGEDRQVVFDAPGTTRDAIDIPLQRQGRDYVLIDTAGVRRKGKTTGIVEKFSVVKALDAMSRSQVALLVIDAQEGLVEQDLHLLSYAAEAGSGIILVVNKCDGLSTDDKATLRSGLDRRLDFAPWISVLYISALHGTGVGHLWKHIDAVYKTGEFDVSTTLLTKLLARFVESHPPPAIRGRSVKLRFAHKAGAHPPRITIYGNQTKSVPASYIRYLENSFRQALKIAGNPIQIKLKTGENPFAGKRNKLNERQLRQRRRIVTHRKKG